MHYYEVAISKIFRTGSDFLTYSSLENLIVGQIVVVEVGKKQIIGIVFKESKKPEYKTKPISIVVENTPIPPEQIELIKWMSDYYISPIATVLQTFLPSGITKKRKENTKKTEVVTRHRTNILFNNEQVKALEIIKKTPNSTLLLHGITGSGKTEVYIELAKRAMADGESSIILTPEISLTPQLISEFSNHFDNLIITHSKMTESSRHLSWQKALVSDQPVVVIGPRSALFLPLKNIGLIVVDESHEPSFKQDQSPKYSTLRVATILGRYHNAKVIFGSATPSISDKYLAEESNRPIIKMTQLARTGGIKPDVHLIDMTKKNLFKKHRFISDKLIEDIQNNIENNHQTLIFHNRRGSTHATICYKCNWRADCPNCFIPLVLHSDHHHLRCHVCSYGATIPTSCPDCGSVEIIHKGVGTKLIEQELIKLFPNANIARFDADNKNNATINSRYKELYEGTINIAIGTQTIAKGLDLPYLRTVGIIQADAGLALPDFSTDERVFQLLTQVIGRVGRNEHKTNVILQTYQPNHPSIQNSLSQDYDSFYEHSIEERRRSLFPPFVYLLKLTCVYKTEEAAIRNARKIAKELKNATDPGIQILGPTPAFYERQNDTYRWQLVIKSKNRKPLTDIARKFVNNPNWQVDIDPTSLL